MRAPVAQMVGHWAFAVLLATQAACLPELKERCRPAVEPAQVLLPPDFAQVDQLLVQRAVCMMQNAQQLRGALSRSFRIYFAEESLPLLCGRLEDARRLAAAGRAREAGRKYQALLVASQVFELAIALHAFSDHADQTGVPSGEIMAAQDLFVAQIGPLLAASLSEDPVLLERALAKHGTQYRTWVEAFGIWAARVNDQAERVKVAKLIWDLGMMVVATYEAATAAADIAAVGRPPMPPLPVLVGAGGVGAAVSEATYLSLAETLRKLIASGALDAAVVAGLSHLMASSQDAAAAGSLLPVATPPSTGYPSISARLSALRPGRSPNVFEVDTEEKMRKLFDELANGGQPFRSNYEGTMVELSDGTRVGMRAVSRSGGPTIDIFPPEGAGPKQIKVHLP